MALSDDRLDDLSREMVKGNKSVNWLASKIEAEVRAHDDALIRQLVVALENSSDLVFKDTTKADARDEAIKPAFHAMPWNPHGYWAYVFAYSAGKALFLPSWSKNSHAD